MGTRGYGTDSFAGDKSNKIWHALIVLHGDKSNKIWHVLIVLHGDKSNKIWHALIVLGRATRYGMR